jgi:hypothetical protein
MMSMTRVAFVLPLVVYLADTEMRRCSQRGVGVQAIERRTSRDGRTISQSDLVDKTVRLGVTNGTGKNRTPSAAKKVGTAASQGKETSCRLYQVLSNPMCAEFGFSPGWSMTGSGTILT